MAEEFSVIGKRLPRADAVERAKGEAKFTADVQLPRMLHAKFLRSPHAHAKITRIDTSKAETLPGVKCILTHKNVPKIRQGTKFEYLLDETVHYAGEEVAAVAAETREIAEEALGLIDVEYEILPAVFDMEEAMKPEAPLVHPEHGSNLFHGTKAQPVPRVTPEGWLKLESGDVEKGFAEADYIIEGTFETQMQYHCSPAPRAVVCQWTGGDTLTCWADTQIPFTLWTELASLFNLPQSKVRVISPLTVGGYGGKRPEKIATLTALLAKRTGRPVKTVFSRDEDAIATFRRLNYKTYGKIGVKQDGTITAIYNRMITNLGRDTTRAFWVPANTLIGPCTMLYEWQNSKSEICQVMTNIVDYAGMNGFGSSEGGFCVERLIDEAAEKIGMDPVKFRIKNCIRYGDRGMDFTKVMTGPIEWGIVGHDFDSLQECLRKVAEKAQWKEKWKGWGIPVEVNGAKRKGIGVAMGMHHSSYLRYSATLKMNLDGTVNVFTQAVEIGQGCKTAMAQVVAETLGVNYEDINVIMADTEVTPRGFGNIGSGGTSSAITAAKYAADDAKRKLFEIASKRLKVKPGDLEAKDRRISVKEHPEQWISISEVCQLAYQITGSAVNPRAREIVDEKTGKRIEAYAVAATIVEVEVDTETGELEVLRITSAHDCGRAINPQIIENQIDMSITMGNGWVRSERFIIDKKTGVVLNPNLLDYKLMTILDMPRMKDMQEIIVEFPCAWGAFGAKGMSETAMTSIAPAMANAIYNAIGVRMRGGYLGPDRILEALGK